jgi:hypothetical protein
MHGAKNKIALTGLVRILRTYSKGFGEFQLVQQVARSDKTRVFSKAFGATPHGRRFGSE